MVKTPPDRIRSIDKKTFEGIATHPPEQASKKTSLGEFGIDVERDVLRAVVGSSQDEGLAVRMAGMDTLTATCRLKFVDLPGKLEQFVEKSQEATYKTAYRHRSRGPAVSIANSSPMVEDEVVSNCVTC